MDPDSYRPAVITFRPDNFLTIGLMAAIVYAGAVIVAQILMRANIIKAPQPAPAAAQQVTV